MKKKSCRKGGENELLHSQVCQMSLQYEVCSLHG